MIEAITCREVTGKPSRADGAPFEVICNVCNRHVENFTIEKPVREKLQATNWGPIEMEHTGEIIFTVSCHGATFRTSSWRGRLPGQ